MKRLRTMMILGVLLTSLGGCEAVQEATENLVEQQAGCKEADLGNLNEPALPNCTKAVACCKFIQGECGTVDLFNFPEEVLAVCRLNESVLSEAISQYQGISDDECPGFLEEEACAQGFDETRENYRKVVDQGLSSGGSDTAPSCRWIVEQTVVPLNQALGNQARFLPKACELGSEVVSPDLDVVTPDND